MVLLGKFQMLYLLITRKKQKSNKNFNFLFFNFDQNCLYKHQLNAE